MGQYQSYQYILYLLEAAACLVGFLYWKKIKHTHWKWFPIYLLIIVLGEQTGNYLNIIESYGIKTKMYVLFIIPFEFMFFYWLFYKEALTKRGKHLAIACAIIYVLAFIADYYYFNYRKMFFSSFSYSIGNLGLLVLVFAFFRKLIMSDALINYKSNFLFWVALGLLVFYLGTLPYFGLSRILFYEYKATYDVYTNVMFVCNWIMYCFFIGGFICSKPR